MSLCVRECALGAFISVLPIYQIYLPGTKLTLWTHTPLSLWEKRWQRSHNRPLVSSEWLLWSFFFTQMTSHIWYRHLCFSGGFNWMHLKTTLCTSFPSIDVSSTLTLAQAACCETLNYEICLSWMTHCHGNTYTWCFEYSHTRSICPCRVKLHLCKPVE